MKPAVIYGDVRLTSLPKECLDHVWTLWGIWEQSHVFFKAKRESTKWKKKDHQHVLLGLRLSSHLTTWKDATWEGCCPRLSLRGVMRWQPGTFEPAGQQWSPPLQVVSLQTNTRRNDPAKPWINLWRSLTALAVSKIPGSLWVMEHVVLHVLPTAASPLTEAEESTWIVTVCSEIHHRAWRRAWVMSNDGDQVWYGPTILTDGEKIMAYTKLPHSGHTPLPTAPCCTKDV